MDRLRPEPLEAIRRNIARTTGGVERLDRRGFLLLEWASPYSLEKPIQLSLEHETRLKPSSPDALNSLLAVLMASLGEKVDRLLLPSFKNFGELRLELEQRPAGAQSVDRYFDLPDCLEFISKGYTFRQRTRSSRFMTWNELEEGLSPLNLELPAIDLQSNGVTARLEFNWKDDIVRTLQEAGPFFSSSQNPVHFAAQIAGMDLRALVPVIENATVRQKFLGLNVNGEAMFALNVDFIHIRNLRDEHEAHFVDVDVSGMHCVNQYELDALIDLSGQLQDRYGLTSNFTTKASRAIHELL